MTAQKTDYVERGGAFGSDPDVHHIKDGRFTCTAPEDAPCRTHPTCDCEVWCCDDPEDHDDGDHCCTTTQKPGQTCWLEPWVTEPGLDESFDHYSRSSPADYDVATGEHTWPDGPVVCDWDVGVTWRYAETRITPAEPRCRCAPDEMHAGHRDDCPERIKVMSSTPEPSAP